MANIVKWGNPQHDAINAFVGQTRLNAEARAATSQAADANRRENEELKLRQEQGIRDETMFRASVESSQSKFAGWDADADTSLYSPLLQGEHQAITDMISDWSSLVGPEADALALALGPRISAFRTGLAGHNSRMAVSRALATAQKVAEETGDEIDPDLLLEVEAFLSGSLGPSGATSSSPTGGMDGNQYVQRLNLFSGSSNKRAQAAIAKDQVMDLAVASQRALIAATQGTTPADGADYEPGVDADGEGRELIDKAYSLWDDVIDLISPDSNASQKEIDFAIRRAQGATYIAMNPASNAMYTEEMNKFKSATRLAKQSEDLLVGLIRENPHPVHGNGIGPGIVADVYNEQNPARKQQKAESLRGMIASAKEEDPSLTTQQAAIFVNDKQRDALEAETKARLSGDNFGAYLAYIDSFPVENGRSASWDPVLKSLDETGGALFTGFEKQALMNDGWVRKTLEWTSIPGQRELLALFGADPLSIESSAPHLVLADSAVSVFAEHDKAPNYMGGEVAQAGVDIGHTFGGSGVSRGIAGIEKIMKDLGLRPQDFVGKQFSEIAREHPILARRIYNWGGSPPRKAPLGEGYSIDHPFLQATAEGGEWLYEMLFEKTRGNQNSRWDEKTLMPPSVWPPPGWTPGAAPVREDPTAGAMPPNTKAAKKAASKHSSDLMRAPELKRVERKLGAITVVEATLDPKEPIAAIKNDDGTISTIRTMSFYDKDAPLNLKGHVLIPTVRADGTIMSDKEAIQHYRETGGRYGVFTTSGRATSYAKQMSKYQAHRLAKARKNEALPK